MVKNFSWSSLTGKGEAPDEASGMTRAQSKHFPRTQDRILVVGTRDDCLILRDGSVVHGPAVFSQPVYEVRVRNGQIEVRPQPRLHMEAAQHSAPPQIQGV